MPGIASVTNPLLTDHAESSHRHPDPQLIDVGQTVNLGPTYPSVYLLTAVANHMRLSFKGPDDEHEAVHATISRVVAGHSNRVTAIVRLVPTSSIQLRDTAYSCAVITIHLDTGETVLSCNRTGTARIVKFSLEQTYADCGSRLVATDHSSWVVYVEFQGQTHRWGVIEKGNYQTGDTVPVRVTDAGYLVLA